MRDNIAGAKKYLLAFISIIVVYIFSMTIVFSFPNSSIKTNVDEGVAFIESEGLSPSVYFGDKTASRIDNFTDKIMLQTSIRVDGENALESSQVSGYSRYWHGYQIILKPLLLIMSYSTIRYLNVFFILLLLSLVFSDIKKRLNTGYGLVYLSSMAMIYVVIFPMSMQFTTAFTITMFAMLCTGYFYGHKKEKYIGLLLFITGSVVNFFDLLTYPLLSLGLPLIYILLLDYKNNDNNSFFNNLMFIIKFSILWGLGYGLSWVAKWVVGSIILKKNILTSAIEQAAFRTAGNEEYKTTPIEALKLNLELMFPSSAIKIITILVILWFIIFIFYKKPWKNVITLTSILLIGFLPYIWYIVLANHSQIHYWFTFRNQAITVFALGSFCLMSLDWEKIKNITSNIKKKN